ncbi:hypothetical protein [Streptomyces luteireticuli]|uniref:hypothetical protein n=1 Tax=Streptomyces luteireticuli TaxID=173858 RepID=UPI0031D50C55
MSGTRGREGECGDGTARGRSDRSPGYACAVLLALMARIPALDRGAGSDRLARRYAAGGRYTVGLAVTHALPITWGYALTTHYGAVDRTTTLVPTYPGMLKATAGFLLLLAAGVVPAGPPAGGRGPACGLPGKPRRPAAGIRPVRR